MNDQFDEIIHHYVEKNEIYNSDIIPILLIYNQEFGNGTVKPEEINTLLQFINANPFISVNLETAINRAIRLIGIKRNYQWLEIVDQNGRFRGRFWNPQDGKIQL